MAITKRMVTIMKQLDNRQGPRKKGFFDNLKAKLPENYERYVTPAAICIVIAAVLVYSIVSALPEKTDGDSLPDVPGTSQEQVQPPMPGSHDVAASGTQQDPYNGLDIAPDEGSVDDGFSESGAYWCVTPKTRQKSHKIHVPAGWEAQAVSGGIRIKPEGYDETAQGGEAVTFWWDTVACLDELIEHGRFDNLERHPNPVYLDDYYEVTDTYMQSDDQGSEYPVYVVHRVLRYDPSGDSMGTDVDEYRFFTAKPHRNGDTELYFVGMVDTATFQSMSTPRFDTIESLVRALFPPSSETGRPAGWDATSDTAPAEPESEPGSLPDSDGEQAVPDDDTDGSVPDDNTEG